MATVTIPGAMGTVPKSGTWTANGSCMESDGPSSAEVLTAGGAVLVDVPAGRHVSICDDGQGTATVTFS